jgi:hypothetical protein
MFLLKDRNDTQPIDIPLGKAFLAIPLGKQHSAATILIIIAILIFYYDVTFGGRTFLMLNTISGTMPPTQGGSAYGYPGEKPTGAIVRDPGAIAWVYEPAQRNTSRIMQTGKIPLWNSSSSMGIPFLTDGNTAALEPLQVLNTFIPDRYWPIAIDIGVLLRFCIAGVCTYLFVRRLNVGFAGALMAGVVFPISSYFVQFGNHPQLKAEILLPIMLYCYERLAERYTISSLLLAVGAMAWLLLASFPESQFLVIVITALWCACRIAWTLVDTGIQAARQQLVRLMGAGIAGLSLSSFFWLPLVETINTSIHVHDEATGLGGASPVIALFSIFADTLPRTGWAPHYYISTITLMILGIVAGIKIKDQRRFILFFTIYGVLFYLKTYTIPITQWIGYLPGFNQLNIPKYITPSVSICFVILAAFGIDAIINRRVRFRYLAFAYLLFAAFTYGVFNTAYVAEYTTPMLQRGLRVMAVAITVISICLFARSRGIIGPRLAGLVIVTLAFLEPMVWGRDMYRPIRYDPYTEPPFITFLKQQKTPYRIIGFDEILFPEISAAYGIDDLRYVTALNSERRFLYLTQFINPGKHTQSALLDPGDIVNETIIESLEPAVFVRKSRNPVAIIEEGLGRFTGVEQPIYMGDFFDLLNVEYILTTPPNVPRTTFDLTQIEANTEQFKQSPTIRLGEVTINDERRKSIQMSPDSPLSFSLLVPSDGAMLDFGIALDPITWQATRPPGDGVAFQISVDDGTGLHTLYQRSLGPNQVDGQAWVDESIDLSRWAGHRINLILTTKGESSGQTQAGIAYWSVPVLRLTFHADPLTNSIYTPLSDIDLIVPLMNHNVPKQGSMLHTENIVIQSDQRLSLSMQPGTYATLPITVPEASARLQFSVALDPDVWSTSGGVGFQATIIDGKSQTEIYNRFVDPLRNTADRSWIEANLDLRPWHGRTVTLQLSTTSLPGSGGSLDPGHWGNIHLLGDQVALLNPAFAHFDLIYNQEILIYRNRLALPRAFIVYTTHPVDDIDTAFATMLTPGFNPRAEAVIEAPMAAGIAGESTSQAQDRIEFIKQDINAFELRTVSDQPGLLVVSDAFFPGWGVTIDGAAGEILPTNGVMRGVMLPAGTHTVVFSYMPQPFLIGSLASLATLLCLASVAVYSRYWTKSKNSRQ